MQRVLSALALAAAAALLVAVPAATPAVGTDSTQLRNAVTIAGIKGHLAQFQDFAEDSIADVGHATRVDDTVGFTESVQYVKQQAEAAGYQVTVQNFTFDRFEETAPPVLERVSPSSHTYTPDTDFITMEYSGSGNVTAPLAAAGGIVIPSPGGSTSGCAASDFAGFPTGAIALIQRGTCTFRQKSENAAAAGAVGVIIFNEGNTADRQGPINGTLSPPQFSLPVVGASFAVGNELVNLLKSGSVTMHLAVTAHVVTTPSQNVIADTPGGRGDRIVVVGAHLDSVEPGPGINDNGSGSATILEVAKQIKQLGISPTNKIRFAWWGGEEFGLLGSEYYVSHLTASELKNLALNLSFDMIASPNFVRFVYAGDGSGTGTKGPTGSGNIEKVFVDYLTSQGLTSEPTAFDGRSDYGPFIDRGIPAGGLFTGAEGIKTAAQAAVYGGTAGVAYDHCYHQACDVFPTNINDTALDQMSDAVADAVLQFAMTTSAVNGTGKASTKAQSSTEFSGSLLRK